MATTSEMTPWATNAECEKGNGVHVMQDEVWTEIVAKDDPNRRVPDLESGAIVYTHLRRESQPMIRFYAGDESHMTHEACRARAPWKTSVFRCFFFETSRRLM
jgi:phenylacetate-CoA ligase